MSGFDCQFTENPPQYLQTQCPICLLVLREPFQVTCCGKSFCRACIERLGAENHPCPTCNQRNYTSFQNKGLQQPLYGFKVSCSNKSSGCNWQGELGQLDQHLNLNPYENLDPFNFWCEDTLLIGCSYTNLECKYCSIQYQRCKLHHHQVSECVKRPFTCFMCKEYKTTHDDVIANHAPVCKCRPVECPNSCGANNLQHQHLEEHVSTQCPLSYVDCDFIDIGCDVKVYRKDFSSHMGENMATHISLLARENRRLKLQLEEHEEKRREQEQKIQKLEEKRQEQEQKIQEYESNIKIQAAEIYTQFREVNKKFLAYSVHLPPINLVCTDVTKEWHSESFYTHAGGYKMKLFSTVNMYRRHCLGFRLLESKFTLLLPLTLEITLQIINPKCGDEPHKMESTHVVRKNNDEISLGVISREIFQRYTKDDQMTFRVLKVKVL